MPSIGVAIITKNAAAHLDECLAAVRWAQQIVVLDSGSTDQTLAIAQAHQVEIHQTCDWPGFGVQKNRALALMQTDWILALDADEVVSSELQLEIQTLLQQDEAAVYTLNRRSAFCGHWVKYSGWQNDRVARLFQRNAAQYSNDLVHERLCHSLPQRHLASPLLHYSYDDYESVLQKINQYSSLAAQQRYAQGKKAHIGTALLRGLWAFLRTYLLRRGFLDGQAGLLIAIMNAETTFYRFVKLQHLNQKTTATKATPLEDQSL